MPIGLFLKSGDRAIIKAMRKIFGLITSLVLAAVSSACPFILRGDSGRIDLNVDVPIFPPNNPWNIDISGYPVHAHSNDYVNSIGRGTGLHADFGTVYNGAPNGIPFIVVNGGQPRVPIAFDYAAESDPGPYPVPDNAPIEGGVASTGDRHVLVIDRFNMKLYELYAAYPLGHAWRAGSGAVWDLTKNQVRPDYWTSADAAGLPVFPGLVRYDEVASGSIRHALRFTVSVSQKAFIAPASHYASANTGADRPPMGLRFRLKAGFDISGFSPANQVILKALKKYGMLVADNGSNWFISGAPDPRWDDDDLHALATVTGDDFEAVETGPIKY
jgi:hypothetical protein